MSGMMMTRDIEVPLTSSRVVRGWHLTIPYVTCGVSRRVQFAAVCRDILFIL